MGIQYAEVDASTTGDPRWVLLHHPALVEYQARDARRSELEAVLGSIPVPIAVVDRSAHPLFTSTGYEELVRAAGGALHFLDQAGEDVPPAAAPLERAARGEAANLELILIGSEGEQHLYQIAVRPIDWPRSGDAVGTVTFRDLGERQRRLREERFLALVAHELRTPLSGIRAYAEVLAGAFHGDLPADDVQALAGRVHVLAERLDLMLTELLDVARISSGKLRMRRRMCDLRDVVGSAVDLTRSRHDAPIISTELPAEPVTLEADPDRLGEVVLNLLTNAVKHATGATRIDARLTITSNGPVIEVEDNGLGIPADDLPHIFTQHYQVLRDGEHGDSSDGLGLGLFIGQQTVTAHGGQLDVSSTPGVGTRFTIRLPRP